MVLSLACRMWQATSCTAKLFAGLTWGYFESALLSALLSALCTCKDEGDASVHLAGDWADAT